MFYNKANNNDKEKYKKALNAEASLSRRYSDNECPYLNSRATENIFCNSFTAENTSRQDNTADAKKGKLGFAIKTWNTGDKSQKIAEFNKEKNNIDKQKNRSITKAVKYIAELRNKRIQDTKTELNIEKIIYHVTVRHPGEIVIYECPLDKISIKDIKILKSNEKSIKFTDGKNTYNFNYSKSTLFMEFDKLEEMDRFNVNILNETQTQNALANINKCLINPISPKKIKKNQLCLPLYSYKDGQKYVFEKSGLNQWNANGRERDLDEIYIPFPSHERNKYPNFFPNKNDIFLVERSDGVFFKMKLCQNKGKAIMSCPNYAIGNWILRSLIGIPQGEIITYETLLNFGIDSVLFTKNNDGTYKLELCSIGTYENLTADE